MTTIGEAVAALNIGLTDDETLAVVTINGKQIKTRPVHQVLDEPVPVNAYLSTGTFSRETKFTSRGDRDGTNVVRVLEFPFDFDLKDFLNCSKEDILDIDGSEVDSLIPLLQSEVERVFRELPLPIHRLQFTGNGLAAFVRIPPHDQDNVADLQRLHKAIVKRINVIWGGTFADPQVSDAGSRIMRLPYGINRKVSDSGVIVEREPRIIYQQDGAVDEAMIRTAAGPVAMHRAGRALPKAGKTMADSDLQMLADAIRPHWTSGHRHALALGVAAMLAKAGVPESQAEEFVSLVADNDDEMPDRLTAVQTTYDRYRRGAEIEGYYALRGYLPADTLAYVDDRLERVRQATYSGGTLLIHGQPVSSGEDRDDKNRPATFDEYPEPPDGAFYGWFGRYVDIMHPTTEATRGFHLAAALTIAGAIAGRRVAVKYASEHIYPNQYTLLVGPTGSSRKGTTMKRAYRLPTYRSPSSSLNLGTPPFALRRDLGSGASVVKTLRENPNTLLVFEEATTLFSNMHRQGGEALLDRLIEAWDTPDFIQDNVKNNPDVAYSPFLSIIAGIQPGRLEDALGANEIESGLANRLCIFFGVRREVIARAPDVDETAAHALYRELFDAVTSYPEGHALTMDAAAGDRWDEWYLEYSSHKGTEDELAMRIRHPDMVQKWALLFAITDRSQHITVEHLTAAIAVLDWMWNGIKRRLPTWGVSVDKKIEELIFQVLKRDGAMKRRVLQQKTARRQWSGREFAAVFRAMAENGHLVTDAQGHVFLAAEVEKAEAQERKNRARASA